LTNVATSIFKYRTNLQYSPNIALTLDTLISNISRMVYVCVYILALIITFKMYTYYDF